MTEEEREMLVEPEFFSIFEEIPCTHGDDDPSCFCWEDIRTEFGPFSR